MFQIRKSGQMLILRNFVSLRIYYKHNIVKKSKNCNLIKNLKIGKIN